MPKKGRNTFSQQEAAEILNLLKKLPHHSRKNQMKVRNHLRKKLGFYISDFTDGKGFNDGAFKHFVHLGDIKIV